MKATTADSFARAMAPNTIRPAAFAAVLPRPTSRFLRTHSSPIPRSGSVRRRAFFSLRPDPVPRSNHDRTFHDRPAARGVATPVETVGRQGPLRASGLPAEQRTAAVARGAAANRWAGLFVGGHLSDAAQPELLVDLRRDPYLHAGGADRDRCCAGDALR